MKETFRGFLQKRKKKQQTAAPSIGLSLEEVYQRQYANGAEENRLFCSKANETEFIVTMHYIHKFLRPDARVIDIGAGLGAYTKKLAEEGHSVDALDLHPENVARMQSAFQKAKNIKVFQADARDLSEFKENAYDLALLMGPIYHLHETEDRIHAIGEALRVVKNGAPVFIAFCLQDAPLIQYVFQDKDPVAQLKTFGYDRQTATVTENTGSSIKVEKTSSVVALIDRICEEFPVVRGALFAQNGLSHTLRKEINEMSDESYQEWIQYLLATAERSDLIGYSNHVVQVLIKKKG
ncbi:MAG: methyltransferase domain-containing protein [Clostridia bacterium]|nr:methyltransferase domain-containing protein [Clostridia bacterium]